jgi:hypothetical protein
MGLDLYAGTLVRYHTGARETEAQRACRDAGIELTTIYASGPPKRLLAMTAPLFVHIWRHRIRRKLKGHIEHGLNWSEARSKPHFARKPDHDGQRALVLAAAYAEFLGLQPPTELPQSHETDPAYAAASKNYMRSTICILECHMFLPTTDDFVIPAEKDAAGVSRFMTSTGNLARALDLVNRALWQANELQIRGWAKRGAVTKKIVTFEAGKPLREEEVPPSENSFEQTAQFGFAVYHEALTFSRTHNVPIITDE